MMDDNGVIWDVKILIMEGDFLKKYWYSPSFDSYVPIPMKHSKM